MTMSQLTTHEEFEKALAEADDKVSWYSPTKIQCLTVSWFSCKRNWYVYFAMQVLCVNFSAKWCGPCQKIAPEFLKFPETYSDCVFAKVDVDENPDTTQKCKIANMPTFQFYRKGEKIDHMSGTDMEMLNRIVLKHRNAWAQALHTLYAKNSEWQKL